MHAGLLPWEQWINQEQPHDSHASPTAAVQVLPVRRKFTPASPYPPVSVCCKQDTLAASRQQPLTITPIRHEHSMLACRQQR
jgi:hypothetical protein